MRALNDDNSLILALDIGTSSVRALLFDTAGAAIGIESQIEYQLSLSLDGGVEIEAEYLLSIVTSCIDNVITALGARAEAIIAVATATFWHSLLGIDAQNQATTPLIMWNDTRSAQLVEQLRARVDERLLHARTGCRLHASYWPAKLAWLAASQSESFRATSSWLSFGDYLYLRLFGTRSTSISMASGTGLFNQHQCCWDDETIALLSTNLSADLLLARLVEVRDLADYCTDLRGEFAARWPALRKIKWFLPLGDGACSNIGSGAVEPTRFALMIGTSGAMRAVAAVNEFTIPGALWCYRLDGKRIVLGGALSNGGNLSAWLRETLQLPAIAEQETALAALKPDQHGLTFLPMLSGERSPGWHDEARATISGLSLATRPIEIMRAGLEAVAYQFAAIYQAMIANIGAPQDIVATGGGLRNSRVWCEIIADTLGTPLRLSEISEASSRGAVLMALEHLKLIAPLTAENLDQTAFGESVLPNQTNHQIYQNARRRYQALYQLLIEREQKQL